ncbi:PAS domain S-box protein [Trichothermofontia sp.]
MALDADQLQQLRRYCRDDGAFAQLQAFLANLIENCRQEQQRVRYDAILSAIPDRLFRLDPSGTYLDFKGNPTDPPDLGQTIVGKTVWQLLPPDLAERCLQAIADTLATGQLTILEYELPNLAGDRCDYEARLVPSGDREVLVLVRDITERKQAELALRASEERLQHFFDTTFEAVLIHEQGRILDVNRAAEVLFGYTTAQMQTMTVLDLAPPATHEMLRQRLRNPNYRHPFEAIGLRHDGSQFIAEVIGKSIRYQGREARVVGIRDITERKQAEEALRRSEARHRALVDALPDIMFRIHRDGTYLDCKAAKDAMILASPSDIIGKNVRQVLPPAAAAQRLHYIEQTLEAGEMQIFEYQLSMPSASPGQAVEVRDYEARLSVSGRDEVLVIVRDITDRKRAEAALRTSEEKFAKAFRSSPQSITIATLEDGRFIEVNDGFERIFGYRREEVIGHSSLAFKIWANPADREWVKEQLKNQGVVYNHEFDFYRRSGERGVGLFSAESIVLDGVSCLLGVTTDITDRKRAEEELRASEQRLSLLIQQTQLVVIEWNLDMEVVEWNPAAEAVFGYQKAEVLGKKAVDFLVPTANQAEIEKIWLDLVVHTQRVGCTNANLTKDGRTIICEWYNSPLIDAHGNVIGIASLARDITEQVRAEAQIKATAQCDRLLADLALRIRQSLDLGQILATAVTDVRQFLQVSRVFIGRLDANWQVQVVAEAVTEGRGSILGEHLQLTEVNPAFFSTGAAHVVADTPTGGHSPEQPIRASITVPIALVGRPIGVLVVQQCGDAPGETRRDHRDWQPHEVDLLERLATQLAIAIQQAELYKQLADLNANLEQQVEQRTAELQQKMEELQELDRQKDVFLHTVTHDLRTPVMGWLMLLKNMLKKPDEHLSLNRAIVERMVESNERQLNLLNLLLETHGGHVRGITLQRQAIALAEALPPLLTDLDPLLRDNRATLTPQIPTDLPAVSADPAQLWRVFENLIINALKHNPPGLHLTITAYPSPVTVTSSPSTNWVRCEIADDGIGLTPEQCERLFELYEQGPQRRQFTGVGLGLYLCRQIIEAHGGTIGVRSQPNAGAVFWFTLPIAS